MILHALKIGYIGDAVAFPTMRNSTISTKYLSSTIIGLMTNLNLSFKIFEGNRDCIKYTATVSFARLG